MKNDFFITNENLNCFALKIQTFTFKISVNYKNTRIQYIYMRLTYLTLNCCSFGQNKPKWTSKIIKFKSCFLFLKGSLVISIVCSCCRNSVAYIIWLFLHIFNFCKQKDKFRNQITTMCFHLVMIITSYTHLFLLHHVEVFSY